ncbi:MAG: hypothetical protein ABIH46_13060 [Chloroflexota bacterium]
MAKEPICPPCPDIGRNFWLGVFGSLIAGLTVVWIQSRLKKQ